ncbi:hypothetical protein C8F01DRAFT_983836 [Mycena amicta]|nr:hypothetical protein C8F01DRAFT_983836 [Mycena amicta]
MFSGLSRFWTPAPTPPPPEVRIVPCTGIDVAVVDVVLTTVFVVDARLDPKKLEDSLSRLIVCKFPRAGARLALRNGKYEFQIPHTFDAKTPAVAFTCDAHAEPYESPSRPSIAKLWKSTPATPFICDVPVLEPFVRAPTCPKDAEGFLEPNTPLMQVHVATFDDLTFIGVSSSHVTFDALGTKTLLHAWTRLLSGEPIDDIPGMEYDYMPFESFTTPAPPGWIQRGRFDLGLISRASFIVRFMLRLFRDPKEVGMHVCMPKAFLAAEKQKIMAELKEAGSQEWVGSFDVLLAWWFKTCYRHRTDSTLLHLHLPADLREHRIFPTSTGLIGGPFINNAVMTIPVAPFKIGALSSTPIREIALQIRRAILAYTADPEGIKNDVHWRCANPSAVGFPCPPGAEYSIQTSWRSAKFSELDFSGALMPVEEDRQRARVVWVTGFSTSRNNMPIRGSGVSFFENEHCIWLGQGHGAKDWAVIKQAGVFEFI